MFPSLNARALGLDLTPEETIDLASQHGYGGVDLLVRDLVDSGADPLSLRRRMDDRGLRGGAWPLPVHWRRRGRPRWNRRQWNPSVPSGRSRRLGRSGQ